MKISSIYYTHKPGGFCKRLYRLLNALAQNGHEVTFYSLDKPAAITAEVKWQPIPFPLASRSGLIFWAFFSIWASLSLLTICIRQHKETRWFVFSPFYAALLLPAKFICRFKLICFVRSKLAPASENPAIGWIETISQKLALKLSDSIVVQTVANKSLALKMGCLEQKIFLLPNNIDEITTTLPSPANKPLQVISTGVFTKKKNLGFLVQVWIELVQLCHTHKKSVPQLQIIGEIRDSDIQSTSTPEGMTFSPWSNNLVSYYQGAQVYLHPSVHEGMPNSVLEALGHGVIALVANTEELKELVSNAELCFDLESPAALAKRILDIQESTELRGRLLALCAERAKQLHFDWDAAAVSLVTMEAALPPNL